MPYITQEKREAIDPVVNDLLNVLRDLELDDPDKNNTEGNINYFVSVLLDQMYTTNYGAMNSAMGLLACIQAEFYNRVAVPYEAQKAHDNGDVYGMGTTFKRSL